MAQSEKIKTGFQIKGSPFDVKVEKNEDGRTLVKGYFSGWNVIDSDADLLMPGAFSKSINDRGPGSSANRKIAHLAFHDQTRPVGVIQVLKEDDKGLYFESLLGTHTEGKDAAKMYEEGTIKEHSIGFRYISEKMEFVELDSEEKVEALANSGEYVNVNKEAVMAYGGYFKIHEVKLFEGSFVTFGANPETPVVKTQEDAKNLKADLDHKVSELMKSINDGEKGLKIERQILYICKQYEALGRFEPLNKHSVKDQAAKEQGASPDKRMNLFEALARS